MLSSIVRSQTSLCEVQLWSSPDKFASQLPYRIQNTHFKFSISIGIFSQGVAPPVIFLYSKGLSPLYRLDVYSILTHFSLCILYKNLYEMSMQFPSVAGT